MKNLMFAIAFVCLSARAFAASTPVIVSAGMRASDPTIMDVVYKVTSETNVVNVRALAFENGTRSFQYVVRPTTFVKDVDGNETAGNIGSNVAANVEHKLAWKVSADWDVDLTKVKFEILVSEQAQLPMTLNHIKAVGKYPALTIGVGEQSNADIFDALLWHYAGETNDFVNSNGSLSLKASNTGIASGTGVSNRPEALRYLYDKMGYEPVEGGNLLAYMRKATRKELWFNSSVQNAVILKSSKPEQLYVGEKAYCVIDMTSTNSAGMYAISYLDYEPLAGWTDDYKTTKLLFRRINSGVGVSVPYYIGVFPLAISQLVQMCEGEQKAGYPSVVAYNFSFVEGTEWSWSTWTMVRGDVQKFNWPETDEVDEKSIVGIFRQRTGLHIDLPTASEWEYACRAGIQERMYSNGAGGFYDRDRVGYYESGILRAWPVGEYLPNFWGIFDMQCRGVELCKDLYGTTSTERVAMGSYRYSNVWYYEPIHRYAVNTSWNSEESVNNYTGAKCLFSDSVSREQFSPMHVRLAFPAQ